MTLLQAEDVYQGSQTQISGTRGHGLMSK